jgi:hypothetical protein
MQPKSENRENAKMTAKVLYTKHGADPTPITWPDTGHPSEQWAFTSGTVLVVQDLIGYGDGSITFASGRSFPSRTANGSTFVHLVG